MKLLLDENLSRHIVVSFASSEIEMAHISDFGLESATDQQIWDFAKDNGYAIVSKDADFHHMSFALGAPPKTIWLKLGNCSTRELTDCLRRDLQSVKKFLDDTDSALMIVTLERSVTSR